MNFAKKFLTCTHFFRIFSKFNLKADENVRIKYWLHSNEFFLLIKKKIFLNTKCARDLFTLKKFI